MDKILKLIVCCDKNYGIGINNELPWNIKSEMNIFKQKTIGNKNNCIFVGKNTYLSIPYKFRPLKERMNYVITTDKTLINNNNVEYININNISEILKKNYDEYWIIGGESFYNYMLKNYKIEEIHITIIDKDYNCNKFFNFKKEDYYLLKEDKNLKDNYSHYIYKRHQTS